MGFQAVKWTVLSFSFSVTEVLTGCEMAERRAEEVAGEARSFLLEAGLTGCTQTVLRGGSFVLSP